MLQGPAILLAFDFWRNLDHLLKIKAPSGIGAFKEIAQEAVFFGRNASRASTVRLYSMIAYKINNPTATQKGAVNGRK